MATAPRPPAVRILAVLVLLLFWLSACPASETSGRSIAHVFDRLHRLRSESITAQGSAGILPVVGSVSYALDAVGNRLSRSSTLPGVTTRTHTYTPDDHLAADTTDANGNTHQSEVPSGSAPLGSYVLCLPWACR